MLFILLKNHFSVAMLTVLVLLLIPEKLVAQSPFPETARFDKMAEYFDKRYR